MKELKKWAKKELKKFVEESKSELLDLLSDNCD